MKRDDGVQLKKTYGNEWSVRRNGCTLGWVWQDGILWFARYSSDVGDPRVGTIFRTKEEAVNDVVDSRFQVDA